MKKILMKRDPYLILYFIMQPLAAICDVLSAKALADAVDFAIRGRLDGIFRYIMAFAALIAVSFIVELTHNRLLWKLFGSRTIALRKECHRKLLYMPYRSFMKKNTGEHISNLTEDVEQVVDGYFITILNMYYDIVIFAITFIALLYINPLIGVFALVISLLQSLVPVIGAKKQELAGEEASDASEEHIKYLRETVSAFATGRTFHIEDKLASRYDRSQKKPYERYDLYDPGACDI